MNIKLQKAALRLVLPIWFNTYEAKNCIDVYETIGDKSDELNKHHSHFWWMVQKLAQDSMILSICKCYDDTNKRYRKHTVQEVLNFISSNFSPKDLKSYNRLEIKKYLRLLLSKNASEKIFKKLENKDDFEEGKRLLIQALSKRLTSIKKSKSMERMIARRNKFLAHQEQVFSRSRKRLLPRISAMEKINNWTKNLCQFLMIISSNGELSHGAASARIATLNVAAKVLGKTFNDPTKSDDQNWAEYEEFYKKLS